MQRLNTAWAWCLLLRDSFKPYTSIGTEFETEWLSKSEIEKIKAAWRAESLDGGKRIVS